MVRIFRIGMANDISNRHGNCFSYSHKNNEQADQASRVRMLCIRDGKACRCEIPLVTPGRGQAARLPRYFAVVLVVEVVEVP